eukprot:2439764-Amphidinium_carterae.1
MAGAAWAWQGHDLLAAECQEALLSPAFLCPESAPMQSRCALQAPGQGGAAASSLAVTWANFCAVSHSCLSRLAVAKALLCAAEAFFIFASA